MSGDEDIEEQMKNFTFPPMPPGISMPPPPPPIFADNLIEDTLAVSYTHLTLPTIPLV